MVIDADIIVQIAEQCQMVLIVVRVEIEDGLDFIHAEHDCILVYEKGLGCFGIIHPIFDEYFS